MLNIATAKPQNKQMKLLPDNSFLSGYQHYDFQPKQKVPENLIRSKPYYVTTDQSRKYNIKVHKKKFETIIEPRMFLR